MAKKNGGNDIDIVDKALATATVVAASGVGALVGVGVGCGTGAIVARNRHPDPIVSYEPPAESPETAVRKQIASDPTSAQWSPAETMARHAEMLAAENKHREDEKANAYAPFKETRNARHEVQYEFRKVGSIIGGGIGAVGLTLAERRRRKKEEENTPERG